MLAFNVVNSIYKSYFIDSIYPNDIVSYHGDKTKYDTSGACGSNETGTGGNGSVRTYLGPMI